MSVGLNPYIIFDGKAEEALNFYRDALDGRIAEMHRYADGPPEMQVGDEHKNQLMHGRLVFSGGVLMVSDAGGRPISRGDNVQLSVGLLDDEATARKVFDALAQGGTVVMPMDKTFWAQAFGMLIDKFGIHWMVNCEAKRG